MTKEMKESWYDKMARTVKSRGNWVLTKVEMEDGGIVEVINVTSAVWMVELDDDIMDSILNQGRAGRYGDTAVLIESAVRGVVNPVTGDVSQVRVYSGIVFVDEYCLNLFVMRRKGMYPDMGGFSRLCN